MPEVTLYSELSHKLIVYVYHVWSDHYSISCNSILKCTDLTICHLTGFVATIYCISFEVEMFHGFHGSIGNCKTFPVK